GVAQEHARNRRRKPRRDQAADRSAGETGPGDPHARADRRVQAVIAAIAKAPPALDNRTRMRSVALDPETLLVAYSQGAFPMPDTAGTPRWSPADPRGIIPLDAFHVPQTLRQIIRQNRFEVRVNHSFETVMRACMTVRREGSWISEQLIGVYTQMYELGYAH